MVHLSGSFTENIIRSLIPLEMNKKQIITIRILFDKELTV